jgi:hypothetical protein
LSEESVVVICSNPKCRKEIEEPILLTVQSVIPPAQYEACPYCFTKLAPEPPPEQEEIREPVVEHEEPMENEDESSPSEDKVSGKIKGSGPRFLQRFKALIPRSDESQKEKIEKPEAPKAEPAIKEEERTAEEEPEAEPVAKEELKEEPKTETAAKKESESSGCPEHFGYLANRPPDTPVPSQCLVCPKMVDCMLSPRES